MKVDFVRLLSLPLQWGGQATWLDSGMNLYWLTGEPILVSFATYIGCLHDLYRFTRRPIWVAIIPSMRMELTLV